MAQEWAEEEEREAVKGVDLWPEGDSEG